jgi:hypothetical protein
MFSCTFYFETATIHSRIVLYINLFYNFVSISKIKNIYAVFFLMKSGFFENQFLNFPVFVYYETS